MKTDLGLTTDFGVKQRGSKGRMISIGTTKCCAGIIGKLLNAGEGCADIFATIVFPFPVDT